MGAESRTAPAMNAHEGPPRRIQEDRIHRAGSGTLAATDTQGFLHDHPPALSLRVGPGRADRNAGGGKTGKARPGLKPRRQPPGRGDPDACRVPREKSVDQPGTGQRTGVTPDAPLHSRCRKDFHDRLLGKRCRAVCGGSNPGRHGTTPPRSLQHFLSARLLAAAASLGSHPGARKQGVRPPSTGFALLDPCHGTEARARSLEAPSGSHTRPQFPIFASLASSYRCEPANHGLRIMNRTGSMG